MMGPSHKAASPKAYVKPKVILPGSKALGVRAVVSGPEPLGHDHTVPPSKEEVSEQALAMKRPLTKFGTPRQPMKITLGEGLRPPPGGLSVDVSARPQKKATLAARRVQPKTVPVKRQQKRLASHAPPLVHHLREKE